MILEYYRYEELGLGAKLTNELLIDKGVVDLLISFCVAGAGSSRANLIFDPFPPDFLDANGQADFKHLVTKFHRIFSEISV